MLLYLVKYMTHFKLKMVRFSGATPYIIIHHCSFKMMHLNHYLASLQFTIGTKSSFAIATTADHDANHCIIITCIC